MVLEQLHVSLFVDSPTIQLNFATLILPDGRGFILLAIMHSIELHA